MYDSLDDALNATGPRGVPTQDPNELRISRVCGHRLAPPYPCRQGCGATVRQAWWKGDRIELVLYVEGPYPPAWVSPRWSSWWWTDRIGLIGRLARFDVEHDGQELYVMHPCESLQYRPGATAPPSAPPDRKAPPPMTTPNSDPFGSGDSPPAVSFKNAPHGTVVVMNVTGAPELVHSLKYGTKDKDYWPAKPGEVPNPKMAAVVQGTVNGELRSFWATKPSALFAAIADAQREAGAVIAAGGVLSVQFVNEDPPVGANEPKKNYRAHYAPPAPAGAADPFAGAQAAAPPAPAAPAPVAATFPPAAAPAAPAAASAPPWAA